MKISVKMTLVTFLLVITALPVLAMEIDTQKGSVLCQLNPELLDKIATACDRCECGCKDCSNSKQILEWKDILNVQKTCRLLYKNFSPKHQHIIINFSASRFAYEAVDAFIARVLVKLSEVAKYHHKTNKITILLDNNRLSDALYLSGNGDNSLLSRLFSCLNKMGLAERVCTLNLSDNGLTDIPDSLLQLKKLTSLDLSRNILSDAAVAKAFTISSLEELSLVSNSLQRLPDTINLTKLEALDVGGSLLTPVELEKLGCLRETLKRLGIAGILDLKVIPAVVPTLVNLTDLSLANNEIPDQEFSKLEPLQNLEELDVCNTNMSRIPDVLLRLPHLSDIDFSNNHLDASEISKVYKIQTLESLTLNSMGLRTIQTGIEKLPKLKELCVSNNQLSPHEIEQTICKIEGLTYLDISDNGLTTLPGGLSNLHNLEILNASSNFLAEDALEITMSLLPRNCELVVNDQVAIQ